MTRIDGIIGTNCLTRIASLTYASSWVRGAIGLFCLTVATFGGSLTANAQFTVRLFPPEQATIRIRDPRDLARIPLRRTPAPQTVTQVRERKPRPLTLNEAIEIALANAEVVRFLAGQTASSSGRTIYDVAVTNTTIDQAEGRFDPTVSVQNSFNRQESPLAFFDPGDPFRAVIGGIRSDDYRLIAGVNQINRDGGTAAFTVNASPTRIHSGNGPLNPQTQSSAELSWTQPLLRGAGREVNNVPIVVARINTERSYFQYKDSVQELVRGVIDAYWAMVASRVEVWARGQQVQQAEEALARAESRFRNGAANVSEPSQARVALTGFRAFLVTAESTLLNREAALRSLLGLPPLGEDELVPYTPPVRERVSLNWDELSELAEVNRPDLIELKLILEADSQLLRQANNQAMPNLDTSLRYRWNGLEGEMLDGSRLRSRPSQHTDWTMAINFSVPIGLRQSRASLRQQQLNIARDQANLEQSLHQILHQLALNVRNLDQFFAQYEAFRATREAAEINLEQQLVLYGRGRAILVDVLNAITSWGNAVSNEAQAVIQYNTELANIERQTGTILESHGIFFFEERFTSVGPRGRRQPPRLYPQSLRPVGPADRYPDGEQPSDRVFNLEPPVIRQPQEIRREPADSPRLSGPTRLELLPPPVTDGVSGN
jgi:outer membrane protein TolC